MSKSALLLGLIACLTPTYAQAKKNDSTPGWVCMQDGKPIKIKAKSLAHKRKKCEAKGGTWEEKAETPPAPVESPKSQSDEGGAAGGGGGGW